MYSLKQILLFTTIVACLHSTAQNKHIFGTAVNITTHQIFVTTGKPAAMVKVYAQNRSCQGAAGTLLYTSNTANFDFSIPLATLDSAVYLLFETESNFLSIPTIYLKDEKFITVNAYEKLKPLQTTEAIIIVESIKKPQVFVKKPVIYLYPKKETDVQVQLQYAGTLLTTYPLYLNGWNVIAQPNGKLFNKNDRRKYEYLFWDGTYVYPKSHYNFTEGFNVKKEDYVSFLEKNLALVGLNDREMNDFIVYWLPLMNKYDYCFIRFNINDDIFGTAKLITVPNFDTQLRLFMEFKGFNTPISQAKPVMQQNLPTIYRNGFTIVEWGGSELLGN